MKTKSLCIKFGLNTFMMYDGIIVPNDNPECYSVCRADESGVMDANRGMVLIDEARNSIIASYDVLHAKLDIINIKEVEGNKHYTCASEFCRADVYVCEHNEWKSKGESIFF